MKLIERTGWLFCRKIFCQDFLLILRPQAGQRQSGICSMSRLSETQMAYCYPVTALRCACTVLLRLCISEVLYIKSI